MTCRAPTSCPSRRSWRRCPAASPPTGWPPSCPLGTKIRDVMGYLAGSDRPVGVVDDDGTLVGSVDRTAALLVVAGDGRSDRDARPGRRPGGGRRPLMAVATVASPPRRRVTATDLPLAAPRDPRRRARRGVRRRRPDRARGASWLDARVVPAVDDVYDWTVRNNESHWIFTWVFTADRRCAGCGRRRRVLWVLRHVALARRADARRPDRLAHRRHAGRRVRRPRAGRLRGARVLGRDDDHDVADARRGRRRAGHRRAPRDPLRARRTGPSADCAASSTRPR